MLWDAMELVDEDEQRGLPGCLRTSTKIWLKNSDVDTLDWPSRSLNLNPMENLWSEVENILFLFFCRIGELESRQNIFLVEKEAKAALFEQNSACTLLFSKAGQEDFSGTSEKNTAHQFFILRGVQSSQIYLDRTLVGYTATNCLIL
uniref:DDE_3 domain-containing protein n=1 Tax=Heterorhabditis bacteriophora TaxID=37862 RepID=A0A1I7WB95_HETBA